jgi:hypothetical protein
MQVHDVTLCRPLLEQAPMMRAGDLLLEDHGFIDGALFAALKRKRRSMSSCRSKPICWRHRRRCN